MTVYNDLSVQKGTATITIQQPVGTISLTTDSPRQFPDTTVNFVLRFEDVPLPSSARYDVAYGDGLKGQ